MAPRPLFLLCCLAAVTPAAVHAFESKTYSTTTRQTSAEVDDIGEIAESGTVAGDGKSAPPPPAPDRLRINVGISPRFTSNAQLSGDHHSGDFLLLPNLEVGYKVPLGEQFSWDNVARVESGIYGRYDERAFFSYSLQSTFDWRPVKGAPRLFVGVEPYRLDRFNSQDRISQAIAFSAGTDYGYGFNNGNSLLFAGYAFTQHFSDPDIDSRIDHSITAGLAHLFQPRLLGQLYYQYHHDIYQSQDRVDNRQIAGVSLTYRLDRYWFLTFSGSFSDNESTDGRASYQAAGGGVSLQFQY